MVEVDISSFLEEFRKTEQTLSDFNYLWKKNNMSCAVYCSPNAKEQYDYIREILEYLVVGIDRAYLIGKGAIFIMYAYFVIQPPNPWQRINIPVTNEELKNFKSLVQAHCDNQEHDVVYLFNKLLAAQAFEIIATHDTIIWGNKGIPKERFVSFTTRRDVITKPTAVKSLLNDGSVLKKLGYLSMNYTNAKESVSGGEVMLDCVSRDLHTKIQGFELEFHESVRRVYSGEPIAKKVTENKAQAVKDKAMKMEFDNRTPLEKRRGRKRPIKEEEVDIKPAQFIDLPGNL